VIDDEKIVRDMVSDALSALGYDVTSCASGEEAVTNCRNTDAEIDLVVLDLTMPGMGGLQCSKELRAINPRLPFVIMSGHALDSQISPLLQEGKITFLQKPFDMRTLSSTVKNALGG
jgi:DNA-binding NtrC family response regulator